MHVCMFMCVSARACVCPCMHTYVYVCLYIPTASQYLELRYCSRAVRYVASGMFVIQAVLYQAVVIYAPALALASISDFPLWVSVVSVGLIASFYTAIVSWFPLISILFSCCFCSLMIQSYE